MSKHAGEAWGGVPAPPGMRGVCVSLGSYRTSRHAGGVGGAPGTSTCAGGGGGFWHLRAFCWGLGRLPAPPCMLEGLGGLLGTSMCAGGSWGLPASSGMLGGLGGLPAPPDILGVSEGSKHLQISPDVLGAPGISRNVRGTWGSAGTSRHAGGLGGLLPSPPPFPGEEPQARCLNTFYARIRGLESGFWSCSLAALPPPLLCLGR